MKKSDPVVASSAESGPVASEGEGAVCAAVTAVGEGAWAASARTARRSRSLLASYMILGKVRLSAMVVVTTALGYVVGAKSQMLGLDNSINYSCLLWTCLGTFLAAVGAAAFNQAIEASRDARMERTKNRPIPMGDISRAHAAYFGLLAVIAGVAVLCPTSNGLAAALALFTVILYVLVYTPLKSRSSTNTLVGAVVGGIPPIIGWTAATGTFAAGALVLGAILFAWQIPHFLALAWMYREDYARGGYKMIPNADPTGTRTAIFAVVYSLLLVPLTLGLTYLGNASWLFAFAGMLLSFILALYALRFALTRTRGDARRLFFMSLIYLPALTILLLVFAQTPKDRMAHGAGGYAAPSPFNPSAFDTPDQG